MSRSFRLLAFSTALALSVTAVPGNAFATPDTAAAESATTSAATPEVAKSAALDPDLQAAERLTAGHQRVGTTATRAISVPIGAGASATPSARTAPSGKAVSNKWPVRLRTGFAVNHFQAPSGDAQFQIASARVTGDRGPKLLYIDVAMRAVPTTGALLVAGFGKVQGGVCNSPGGANLAVSTTDYSRGTNRIRVFDRRTSMASLAWNCVIAAVIRDPNAGTFYDGVTSYKVASVRQQPAFGVVVRRASLTSSRYKKVKFQIRNSPRVIATAPNVRLTVKTRGPVAVRYRKKIGTLKPGQLRRGNIQVRLTGRGSGRITYIFRSKDYRVKLTTRVRSF